MFRPSSMKRRHFLQHLASAAAFTGPALALGHSLRTHAQELRANRKSAILLWMNGGPSTIDIWDLKPESENGGEFRPIGTSGDVQICEHLPLLAKQMHNMAIIRSMNTREADHGRGRYYMHTGYVPNPSVQHPSLGAVVSRQLRDQRADLEIPPFVTVGGGGESGPGFLGMAWAPFAVTSAGRIKNLEMPVPNHRMAQRMATLDLLERGFISRNRGAGLGDTLAGADVDHRQVVEKTVRLMTSQQMKAFRVTEENQTVRDRYGDHEFGRGCLMARRLVETGVPFVEVDFGGWDNHSNIFTTLADQRLPQLDQAMSALFEDLEQRGLLQDTAIIWMGEFGRTPRVNGRAGRDHWARAWSVVMGGAGMNGGIAVGSTNRDGTLVETEPYTSQDVMATVCRALGISLETVFTSRSGRPMKIANSGRVIRELIS